MSGIDELPEWGSSDTQQDWADREGAKWRGEETYDTGHEAVRSQTLLSQAPKSALAKASRRHHARSKLDDHLRTRRRLGVASVGLQRCLLASPTSPLRKEVFLRKGGDRRTSALRRISQNRSRFKISSTVLGTSGGPAYAAHSTSS